MAEATEDEIKRLEGFVAQLESQILIAPEKDKATIGNAIQGVRVQLKVLEREAKEKQDTEHAVATGGGGAPNQN